MVYRLTLRSVLSMTHRIWKGVPEPDVEIRPVSQPVHNEECQRRRDVPLRKRANRPSVVKLRRWTYAKDHVNIPGAFYRFPSGNRTIMELSNYSSTSSHTRLWKAGTHSLTFDRPEQSTVDTDRHLKQGEGGLRQRRDLVWASDLISEYVSLAG